MIHRDETTTIATHHRRITFVPGTLPELTAKKNRGRVAFTVTHLALRWTENTPPGAVIAHGFYHHPTVGKVYVERSFDLDGKKTPRWVKDAVNGADQ